MTEAQFLRQLPDDLQQPAAAAYQQLLAAGWSRATLRTHLEAFLAFPARFVGDAWLGGLARQLAPMEDQLPARDLPEWPALAPYDLGPARRLPVAVYGAVLPGAQAGLGLPNGAVLATRQAVIPRALGRDLGCRITLTVFSDRARPKEVRDCLSRQTRFGDDFFEETVEVPLFDDPAWATQPLAGLLPLARRRFGSSGTGNHFVDFGFFEPLEVLGTLRPGRRYQALLTHSGSRGLGLELARHFHRLARRQNPGLPRALRDWAWLSQDSPDYEPFWQAVKVCLTYSEASHRWLHERIAQTLGLTAILGLSCPHNFASLEDYRGQRAVVHRKGAIRLGPGELGLMAGSMTAPTYLVRGRDDPKLLFSAAHGAGRLIGRSTARRAYRGRAVAASLGRVRVLQSAPDEWPAVYHDVETVVTAHGPVLDRVGRFWPRVVRMCAPGFAAED